MSVLGQLGEVQSLLQLQCVLLKSVTHCVYYSLCALPFSIAEHPTHQIPCEYPGSTGQMLHLS